MSAQASLDKFYNIDNVISINIEMENWDAVKNAVPTFGWRADRRETMSDEEKRKFQSWPRETQKLYQEYKHYDWQRTAKMTITGTVFPTQPQEFKGVSIVKKSFGGSQSTIKPSLKLNFGRVAKADKKNDTIVAEAAANATKITQLIGTQNLTLNNCIQDPSYIRQPLGYTIFRQLGVPASRCNFAKVKVNGIDYGVYVNVEQVREPYLQRNLGSNDTGNDKGNLYETEWRYDLTPKHLLPSDKSKNFPPGFNQDGFSGNEDQNDLRTAVTEFDQCLRANPRSQNWKKYVDLDNLVQFMAAQAVLNHWDGYPNNTFIYNDVKEPTAKNIKLKLIPSGIDAILIVADDHPHGRVKIEGVLSQLVVDDVDAKKKLDQAIIRCTKTFNDNLAKNQQLIAKMDKQLQTLCVTHYESQVKPAIKTVNEVMDNVASSMAEPVF